MVLLCERVRFGHQGERGCLCRPHASCGMIDKIIFLRGMHRPAATLLPAYPYLLLLLLLLILILLLILLLLLRAVPNLRNVPLHGPCTRRAARAIQGR